MRYGPTLIRLACLYAILCYLGVEIALTVREIRENERLLDVGSQAYIDQRPAPPFLGVTVALEQYQEPGERRQALERLERAGFGWVRQRFDWGQLEPRPGEFQWAWADAVLIEIVTAGLVPVVVLDGSPAWARDQKDRPPNDNPFAPPERPQTFGRFAAAFAARYQSMVRYYQIWDEPNIAPHWGNRHIDPVAYTRLLQTSATAVRGADGDAVILTAALAPTQDRGHTAIDEGYFLQRMYAANAGPYFDALAVQPFGFGTGLDDLRSRRQVLNFRRLLWIRRVMVAADDAQTPIWAVRFGWNRRPNDLWRSVSETNQSLFAGEAVRHARVNWPWLVAMGWVIDRPDALPNHPLWGFALFGPDGSAEPVLAALTAAASDGDDVAGPASSTILAAPTGRLLLLLVFAGAILGWGIVTARSLPLARWRRRIRDWPLRQKLAVWSLLLIVYYFAVWPPLIVLCWLIAGFLIVASPISGMLLAAALLPFHFQHKELRLVEGVWALPPAQAALLASLPAVVWLAVRRRVWRIEAHLPRLVVGDQLVLAWLGISFLSGLNVWHWPGYVQGMVHLVVVPALLYTGVRLFAASSARRRLVGGALFVGGVLAAAIGVVDWLAEGGVVVDGVRRLMGASFSPNQAALYLVRSLFVGVGLWAEGAQRRDRPGWFLAWLLAGCLLVGLAALLTASRGGLLLGVPAGLLVLVLAGRGRGGRQNRQVNPGRNPATGTSSEKESGFLPWYLRPAILVNPGRNPATGTSSEKESGFLPWYLRPTVMGVWVLMIGLLAVSGLFLVESAYGERLLNSNTVRVRFAVWQGALALWQHYLLLGVGPGGYFWNYPAFLPPAAMAEPALLHPHSLWLELVTGWGAVGLLWLGALLAWLFAMLRTAWRGELSWFQLGLVAGLVAGLAHAQVDAFAALPELAAWNFIVLALLQTRKGDGQT